MVVAVGCPKVSFPRHLSSLLLRNKEPMLHDLFDNSAIAYPDVVAVDDMEKDVQWTYGELRQKAIYLSHMVRAMGVRGEDYVGVLLPRGGEFYWCMLGILKAGGAYVSLDPDYPAERIQATVEDSKAKLILTDDNLISMAVEVTGGCAPPSSVNTLKDVLSWAASVPEGQLKILPKSIWAEIYVTSASSLLPPTQLSPSFPAYAIFTSGSTGRPKGVCIEHRSAVNFVLGEQRSFPTSHTDRVLQGFSTSFDASVEEMWLAFASGATLVVGTKTTMRSGPSLGVVLAKMGITVFSTVPTVLRLVEDIPSPPLLRIVITGGEACPPEVVEKWSHPERQLLNTYGPTEAAVVATYTALVPNKAVTIGRPLPGYSAHIISETGDICEVGKPGELWLGGVSVARGYINREDLNKEKFPVDAFGAPRGNWDILKRLYAKHGIQAVAAGKVVVDAEEDGLVDISDADAVDAGANDQDDGIHVPAGDEEALNFDESETATFCASRVSSAASKYNTTLSRSTTTATTKSDDVVVSAPPRLYRTGDLVQWNSEGEIEFLGRIDSQVKIRGFRVELSEIESAIMRHPSIGNICVLVRMDCANKSGAATKQQTLCAYIEPKQGCTASSLTPDAIRDHAASILPDYMVPQRYVVVESIKLSPSGKVDRKALEALPPPSPECAPGGGSRAEDLVPLEGGTEELLAKLWKDVLGVDAVGASDDFFKIGGTSLSAAQFISALRKICPLIPTAVGDLYAHKTIRELTKVMLEQCEAAEVVPPELVMGAEEGCRKNGGVGEGADEVIAELPEKKTTLRHYLVWFCQLIVLTIMGGVAASWIGIGIIMTYMVLEESPLWYLFITWPLFALTTLLFYIAGAVLLKWILLGTVREGEHEVWGWYYLRWWTVETIGIPMAFFAATPMNPFFLRFLGARIGRNVHIASAYVCASDLLTIEDDVVINVGAQVCCTEVQNGKLKFAPIHIGKGAILGFRAAMKGGSMMEAHSELGDLGVLMCDQVVPRGEKWIGAPARLQKERESCPVWTPDFDPSQPHQKIGTLKKLVFCLAYVASWYLLAIVLFAPVSAGLSFTLRHGFLIGCMWSPLFVICGVSGLLLFTIIVKWCTVGKIQPGSRPLYGWFYTRWLMNYNLQQLTTVVAHPFYSTMFTRSYLNALGARLGRRVEISDAREWTPDMLEIGDDCFVADFVGLGGWRVGKSREIFLGKVKVGAKTFLGNNACIPGGVTLPADALLGVYTLAPSEAATGGSYLGSPPFPLANRAVVKNSGDRLTFKPPMYLYPIRGAIELFRTMAPPVIATEAFMLAWFVGRIAVEYLGLYSIAVSPMLFCLYGGVCALVAVVSKHLLVGNYSTTHAPLWSTFVWRAELSTALEEDLAFASFIRTLVGTPYLSVWFRLLGAKIGSRVYLASPHLTEPDLISIGDDCCINSDVTVQGHLFEDRIMKMDRIEIGKQCTIGTRSVVLYTSKMGDGATLAAVSLMMKGEEYPPRSYFGGLPAAPVRHHSNRKGRKTAPVTQQKKAPSPAPVDEEAPAEQVTKSVPQQPSSTTHAKRISIASIDTQSPEEMV